MVPLAVTVGAPPIEQHACSHAVNGKDYPAGTLFDFEEDGKIEGVHTPDE